ncbi:MAG: hypothetical protein QOE29_1381 [Gaiellaceae bacterium]|nr:hypothetical protein [Gaiellaceae bacterium]
MDAAALQDELARQDSEVAAALAQIETLMDASAQLAAREATISAFLATWPEERSHRDTELAHALDELSRALHELEQSAAALAAAEHARDQTRLKAARRHHEHALGARQVAEQHQARLRARVSALAAEREATLLERDLLLGQAQRLAEDLHAAPRLSARAGFPIEQLDALPEWASSVRAALLVARSGLAAEREALLRQAAELAATATAPPS